MYNHDLPAVAVIIPVRNEAETLRASVAAILVQEYGGPLEVCLALAPSTDGSEEIVAELEREHRQVRAVPNPAGATPAGLNAAIAATTAEIIVRVDGHSTLSPDYVDRAVQTMVRTGAANVGGMQRAVGTTPFENAVATAMGSRFGVGGARFHTGGREGPVDTVYLGVFRRAALEQVGGFDERLIRNQDYELNVRLRAAGGVVWFDPELWVTYRPRSSPRALARQYFEYGRWKREVLRMHPSSLKFRQSLPPVVLVAVVGGTVAGLRWRRGLLAPIGYVAAVSIAGLRLASGTGARPVRIAAVLATMHLAWGAGFVIGPPRRVRHVAA